MKGQLAQRLNTLYLDFVMDNHLDTNFEPVIVEGSTRQGPWLLTCDHASNAVPPFVNNGCLGLPHEDMNRHIAYDVGAAGVTSHLAKLLDAPAVMSTFSRLVIDPNRGEDDPTLIMQLYDGTIIPGNRDHTTDMRSQRLDRLHRPYHQTVSDLAHQRPANSIYLAIHSFTPQLSGRPPRPWQIGVLYAHDRRVADPLMHRLRQEPDLHVGDNQPYNGALRGDATDRHALQHDRLNGLIELRNDLIETETDQVAWAERLAPILEETRLGLL